MAVQPEISIIIPVHNGAKSIGNCLEALFASSYQSFEIIVVDGGSTDNSAAIAKQQRAIVLQVQKQAGVAVARNFGVRHARGNILLFIDADVVARKDTLTLIKENFQRHPEIVAVFGSYDDEPAEKNFISQFRNLFHHFHHQNSNPEAFTFWTGCGAIQKKIFEEMGGFDENKYVKPSIEDIELGYRIRKKGYRILLDKRLLVKHLKRWEFLSMLRTDIFQRAIPWSRLILESKSIPSDLNLQKSQKISAISLALLIIMLPFSFFSHAKIHTIPAAPVAGLLTLALFINILLLNRKLYSFFSRKRGILFLIKAIPLHFLYYFYSGLSFVFCWIMYKISFFISLCHVTEDQNARIH